jgi:hypothetical protein
MQSEKQFMNRVLPTGQQIADAITQASALHEPKLPKDAAKRRKALESQLSQARENLSRYIKRYDEIRERRDEAMSEYDLKMGYGWEFGLDLKRKHICFARGRVIALEGMLRDGGNL